MTVRAKFRCTSIQSGQDDLSRIINMTAVTSGSLENEAWSKFTPYGDLRMCISNPAAFEQFEEGTEYFIDISKA